MARPSILSDDLLRQLVAVGQVDILVGVPTFNNAATIEAVVKALHVGLARHFPRERTVIINPDGGSDDGTVDHVRAAPMADEEMRRSTALRTTHRVSALHAGLPGRASGVRTVLAAADLLQARVVVLVDAHVTSMTPDWVAELALPVWRGEADLVMPIHPRNRYDGPLLTQLVRPLLAAAYARRLRFGSAGALACSGRLAARMTTHPMWQRDVSRAAFDVWLVATALADDLPIRQAHLGPRVLAPQAGQAGLPELFEQVMGTTFTCLDGDASTWMSRTEPADLVTTGVPREADGLDSTVELAPMVERFRSGVRDLAPLLREILSPAALAGLQSAASSADDTPRISDSLWVSTVYEFAASAHRAVMSREHLTQAMVPLYLGRTASFFAAIRSADEPEKATLLTMLEQEYEKQRPYLIERWTAIAGGER